MSTTDIRVYSSRYCDFLQFNQIIFTAFQQLQNLYTVRIFTISLINICTTTDYLYYIYTTKLLVTNLF